MPQSVLLTNLFVSQFSGSELDTLETARWFLEQGWEVEVAALQRAEPLSRYFDESRIKVTLLPEEPLSRDSYDLLWGHHWPVINHIVYHNLASFKKAVHICLGVLEPLESAVAYHDCLSACFAISKEVKQSLIEREGVAVENVHVSPNAADSSYFSQYTFGRFTQLRRLAVISNHICAEARALSSLLSPLGVDVCYIGMESHTYRLVDAPFLQEFDLVVTIGRTVQRCFACGVPVYCYDHFGGPGYIHEANIDLAEANNFSGRGFDRHLHAEELAEDICSGYPEALKKLQFLHETAKKRYCFDTNMVKNMHIIEASPDCRIKDMPVFYRRFARANDAFINSCKFQVNNWKLVQSVNVVLQEVEGLKKEVASLKEEVASSKKENTELCKTLDAIRSSRSYMLARKLSNIYQSAKRLLSAKE